MTVNKDISGIVGKKNIFDDPEILEDYTCDGQSKQNESDETG